MMPFHSTTADVKNILCTSSEVLNVNAIQRKSLLYLMSTMERSVSRSVDPICNHSERNYAVLVLYLLHLQNLHILQNDIHRILILPAYKTIDVYSPDHNKF